MSANIERDLKLLKDYALLSSILVTGVTLTAFTRGLQKARFDEIDVGRINVIEKDGTLRLVIANRAQSPGPMYRGRPFGYAGGNRPGLIFFNEEGTEDGGLTWGGRTENGRFNAGAMLAFDQYDQDQVVYLQYADDNGRRLMGLTVADRADYSIKRWVDERDSVSAITDSATRAAAVQRLRGPRNGVPLFAQRVFVGRDRNKSALVSLGDRNGKERLRLSVDSLGAARVQFLDAEGRLTYALPEVRQ